MFYGHFSIALWRVLTTLAAHKCAQFIIITQGKCDRIAAKRRHEQGPASPATLRSPGRNFYLAGAIKTTTQRAILKPLPLCLSRSLSLYLFLSCCSHNGGNNH